MKLRKRKKSQTGKTIAFLVLSIISIGVSILMAHKLIGEINTLNQTNAELKTVQAPYSKLEENAKEVKLKEQTLKEETLRLEQRLDEIKKKYPSQKVGLGNEPKKYAYLTFDDGPSKNTDKILDFLKENHIKATFFVVGDPGRINSYKRIVNEGHTLGIHSYTHKYKVIYRSVYSFTKDIEALSHLLWQATGTKPNILRFPGGSNNSISENYSGYDIMAKIIPKMKKEGFIYFDWNVDSGDAHKDNQNPKIIANKVLNQTKDKDYAIILMHDAGAKTATAEALPVIVAGLRKQGFIFKELSTESKPIHFR